MDSSLNDLTEQQKAILRNETLVREILAIRGIDPTKQQEEPGKPSPWMTFLLSGTGTALVTVVLGGVLGTLITNGMQNRSREREAREQALQQFGNSERVQIGDAFSLAARLTARAEDVATLAQQQFFIGNGDGLKKLDRDKLKAQREAVLEAYNAADDDWREKRYSVGLLLGALDVNGEEVRGAWIQAADAATDYATCEQEFGIGHLEEGTVATPDEEKQKCAVQRTRYTDAQRLLFAALSRAERCELDSAACAPAGFWSRLFSRSPQAK